MVPRPFWQARTGGATDELFTHFSESVGTDTALVPYDLAGSVAHVLGLVHCGLLSDKEAALLVGGLQGLAASHEAGTLELDPALEDVHMNVEARLIEELGDVGRKLHTGRSRNDQVALDLVLFQRHALSRLAGDLDALSNALAAQALEHRETPWLARTHGQGAQPATLGFLLAAHAWRVHDLAQRTLFHFGRLGESPLGSGAVAGSTLPLDPAFTADLLGLGPPRNALLATGSRDGLVETLQLTSSVGLTLASLAQDLTDLFEAGALTLPEGFSTGSSLMPHKRNPDALELVRGTGASLQGELASVTATLAHLPLGYHRDLQVTKPPLVGALGKTGGIVAVTLAIVEALAVDEAVLAASLAAPGITTTDAAEALVAQGVPFRTAYLAVADAVRATEEGGSFESALSTHELEPEAIAAALAALTPDPSRRATIGGPAPAEVLASLERLSCAADALQPQLHAALDAANAPLDLLATEPAVLVSSLEVD